jgi:PAS domain-containing protein
MYVSPLIDPKGQQTGWMTSMTNITEAKRIRDQLSASHERFTTVLEGLDASVSVLSVQQGELLFANRSYRLWFGADAGPCAVGRAAASPAEAAPTTDDDVDSLSGLPAQELTETGRRPARGLRRAAAEVVRRARALPAVDRRPAGADADRHRHHGPARAEEQAARRPRRRRSPAGW